ncbi:MAG: ADP-ribosylglycohydrolase family protein [Planctomycetota bacterium]|nr:MAG: ADP-ribosylglycohydrolase family protein [Planctomycetota bacterium]
MPLSPDPAARRARALAALEGLSVGDAFGERFLEPGGIARLARRELAPPPWRWTDDTAMALSVVEVLCAEGRIEPDALARAFARRYATDPRRGYGRAAHGILRAIGAGVPWREASAAPFGGQGSFGNGGAMRAAPIGAYFADDPARVAAEAEASALPTHHHPEGRAGAVAVAVAAAWVLRSEGRPAALFEAVLASLPPGETRAGVARAAGLSPDESPEAAAATLGSGQRVSAPDTVPFCLWVVARHREDYAAALWCAARGLGDADTTCAIVGGILGAALGPDAIPQAWREAREPLPAPSAAGG